MLRRMSNPPPEFPVAFMVCTQLFSCALNGLICWIIYRYYRTATAGHNLKYRTFWPRLFGQWIDSFVFAPLSLALVILPILGLLPPVPHAMLHLAFALGWAFYMIEMHRRRGQTLGKMATKVKLVDYATEGPITTKQAYLREGIPLAVGAVANLYYVYLIAIGKLGDIRNHASAAEVFKDPIYLTATSLPLLWFVVEVITMLCNDKRRALHDYIAGTVIIRTNLIEMPPLPAGAPAIPKAAPLHPPA